eukprot:1670464-Amphidinium_carterae.1
MPIAGGDAELRCSGVGTKKEAREVVCPVIALPFPAGRVPKHWLALCALVLRICQGLSLSASAQALPEVLMTAG